MTDPGILEAYLEDASGSGPGRAAALLRPSSEAEIASWLRATAGRGVSVLPQAARSSLTGGAIPQGDVVVSAELLTAVGPIEEGRVTVGAGVRLKDLQHDLARRGLYYPPVPTYQEAMVGGTVSTNAGGAATFKYGVTRQWVRGLRVLLFNGDLLEIERGQEVVRRGENFAIELSDGRELRVPAPRYALPPLKKISAGYHAADPLDLVDLFVGCEGTLGFITSATLGLVPCPAAQLTGMVFLRDPERALTLSGALRAAGEGIRAIEFVDGRCLDLLRRHGDARRLRVAIPEGAGAALLFEVELPRSTTDRQAQEALERFLEGESAPGDLPLSGLFRLLVEHEALDDLELAFPEDAARSETLREFREAVPKRVNEELAARRRASPGVKKVGGDLIVPVAEIPAMLRVYEEGFASRGLEFAIWGHLSDGNLHPNALPRDAEETARGFEALLEFAAEAARRGGCPLSEHGVGRNPIKQEMLRRFLGDEAIAEMRAVKRALDPEGRFAPGVIFPVPTRKEGSS